MSAVSQPPAASPGRGKLVWSVRLTVSAVALATIFYLIPVDSVTNAAKQISAPLWVAALALFLAGHAAAAAKWRLLLGNGISYQQAFRAHLAGLAANLTLPGVAGGDVVRAALAMRNTQDKSRVVIGSISDRLLDTLGLAIIALVGGYVAWGSKSSGTQLRWLLLAAAAGLIGALAAAPLFDRLLTKRPAMGRIGRLAQKFVAVAADLSRQPERLLLCLVISMAVQCLFVLINIALARAAHVDAPVAAWFFAWTVAKIIAIAPISLGGLGIREASMASLLKPFGADPAGVIATGLIWQSVLYASGAIGLLVQVRRPSHNLPVER